jgi:hypothetical protein
MLDMEGGTDDPQAIASMLQEQLNAVDSEIRLIEEEKHNTKRVADQLEQNWGDTGMHSGYDDPSLYFPPNVTSARTPRTQYDYPMQNKYNTVSQPIVIDRSSSLFRCPTNCRNLPTCNQEMKWKECHLKSTQNDISASIEYSKCSQTKKNISSV